MTPSSRVGCAVAACLVAAVVQAQPQTQSQPPAKPRPAAADPLDARAAVPPAVHVSSLARYRAAGDLSVGSWREANDTVARIGGWKAYAREAQSPAAPASHPVPGTRAHGHP